MLKIKGKYTDGIIYTDKVDDKSIEQIKELLDTPFMEGLKTRFMPDVHAGNGSVIGTTIQLDIKNREIVAPICVNITGLDIGCGILTVYLGDIDINFEKLDNFIKENIPYGMNVREYPLPNTIGFCHDIINGLYMGKCIKDVDYICNSLGTLGSGNHMIEIGQDVHGEKWLIVHTGSRNLGNQIAKYYQDKAIEENKNKDREKTNRLIQALKDNNLEIHIEDILKLSYKVNDKNPNKDLMALEYKSEGVSEQYKCINDMYIATQYAIENRFQIAELILGHLGISEPFAMQDTMHNYISLDDGVLRKGAVSAHKGEKSTIPINMRDGFLICEGKGNPDWNYSAPHGAGRVMSRSEASKKLCMEDFKESMKGIYSNCVNESTLDESPMAYKNMRDIVNKIGDTVDIILHVKPLYNFKA